MTAQSSDYVLLCCVLFCSQDKDLAPALTEELALEIMTDILKKLKFTGSKMCDAKDGKFISFFFFQLFVLYPWYKTDLQ
jgi:hypothetical protein